MPSQRQSRILFLGRCIRGGMEAQKISVTMTLWPLWVYEKSHMNHMAGYSVTGAYCVTVTAVTLTDVYCRRERGILAMRSMKSNETEWKDKTGAPPPQNRFPSTEPTDHEGGREGRYRRRRQWNEFAGLVAGQRSERSRGRGRPAAPVSAVVQCANQPTDQPTKILW